MRRHAPEHSRSSVRLASRIPLGHKGSRRKPPHGLDKRLDRLHHKRQVQMLQIVIG